MLVCQNFILDVLLKNKPVNSLPWGDPETYNEFFLIETLKWYEETMEEMEEMLGKDSQEYKEMQPWKNQLARLLIFEFVYNCFDEENSYKFHDFMFGKMRKNLYGPVSWSVIYRTDVWGTQQFIAKRVNAQKRSKDIKGSLKRIPVNCMSKINLLIPKFINENIHFCSYIHLDNKIDKFGNWHTSVHFIKDREHILGDCYADKADRNTEDKIKDVEEELRSIQKWLEE